MRKMYQDLKGMCLEAVLVTRPYGYFESEGNLSPEQEYKKMKGYLEKWELPFPLVIGTQENFTRYGVGGIPHYAVVGRDGKVASWTIGYNEELHNQLRKSVEEELAKTATEQK